MPISIARTTVVIALLGVGVAGLIWLHRSNGELQREVAELRRQNEERIATRAEQERKRAAASSLPVLAESRPAPTMPPAPAPARADEPATPSAPLTAMLRVEELTNRGRANPVDALQTLIWAAIKGDDDEFAASLVFGDGAREMAEVWRATLPAESQARFATLEKLPGLFLTEEIVRKAAGLQIMQVVEDGSGKMVVHARTSTLAGGLNVSKFPLEQTATGWRLTVPDKMIAGMQKAPAPQPGQRMGSRTRKSDGNQPIVSP